MKEKRPVFTVTEEGVRDFDAIPCTYYVRFAEPVAEEGLAALAEQSRKAVREDKAECILLGCAGFVDFVKQLKEELGVPVLDGVVPAVKFAEAMVDMGLKTSKVSTWGWPEPKAITGFPMFDEGELFHQ